MSGTKTSWEDLARLGVTKRRAFTTLNAKRGGTMSNESHLHLNDSFVEQYGWYCYNLVKGQATKVGSRPVSSTQTVVRHVWDNTQNSKPQTEKWTEKITKTSSATLSTTTSASITLEAKITVFDVASSGYSLSVGTESKTEDTTSVTEEITREFQIEVGPYEKLELHRTKQDTGEVATYHVPYGVQGMIGTQGEKYNGHYHWGYDVNSNFNYPSGYIELMGVANETDYSFTMVRTGGKGAVQSKVSYVNPAPDSDEEKYLDVQVETGEVSDAPKMPMDNKAGVAAGF
ncbi:hypothetical protein AX17_002942 [Amanita inopinata Kibby_2008]|nr:hypothetical protein AX17_002942 [Amanita inopinata Kibby_2008]